MHLTIRPLAKDLLIRLRAIDTSRDWMQASSAETIEVAASKSEDSPAGTQRAPRSLVAGRANRAATPILRGISETTETLLSEEVP